MSRTDHPAFVTARTQNRHLRVVPPPETHTDPCGNAIAGAAVAIVIVACTAALVWVALWWRP